MNDSRRKSGIEGPVRRLVLLLGDQLDPGHAALAAGDPARDAVLMIETAGEAEAVWSHKQRIALFLSAMRHRAEALRDEGWRVLYLDLGEDCPSLSDGLARAAGQLEPDSVSMVRPGEWRVLEALRGRCRELGLPLELVEDGHFYCTPGEFEAFAEGRKRLLMEHFYRRMRRRHGVLMDGDGPAGDRWNLDAENRESFGADGPGETPDPPFFEPDAITREVIDEVEARFGDHPGSLGSFRWPVTPAQAAAALGSFVSHRLPRFGAHQDAMWSGRPFLYHSLLSAALNLKLLDPRQCVEAAERAWREERAPLASVEGFVRQILGWREFVRGVYWLQMPGYAGRNALDARRPLPAFYWSGETEMNCLRQAVGQTMEHGYAHHIQRLMITGNFALLAGIEPAQVCDWYLAVYVDAVEWVELPNTLGMALHADGGVVGTKPYAAGGNYVNRMSDYCRGCRYDPRKRTGDDACPFTFLYWDFLARHRERFAGNPRMALALRNLKRMDGQELAGLRGRAASFLDGLES